MDSERRRTFRAQLKTLVEATLVVGKQNYDVRVVDESAGGMMVASSTRIPVKEDELIQIRTHDAAFELRVVRVENRGMGMRIGLERVRELAPPKPVEKDTAQSKAVRMYRWAGPSVVPAMVFGTLLVAATVMVTVLQQAPPTQGEVSTISSLFRPGSKQEPVELPLPSVQLDPQVRRAVREQDGLGIFRLPEVLSALHLSPEQSAQLQQLVTEEQRLLNSGSSSAEAKEQLTKLQVDALDLLSVQQRQILRAILRESVSTLYLVDQLAREQWPRANARQLIDRLGAAGLTLPRVIDQLGLSAEQTTIIQDIVEQALDESQQLYNQARSSTTPEVLQKQASDLLDKALADALRYLTPEQRAKLESMRQ